MNLPFLDKIVTAFKDGDESPSSIPSNRDK